jgi:hypothetical protein
MTKMGTRVATGMTFSVLRGDSAGRRFVSDDQSVNIQHT